MGEFIKRVQSGKISGPLRRNFTPSYWQAQFAAVGVADDDDLRIYDAALVLHSKLESIRSRLKLSSSPTLSATTKLRAFVAAANHNFLVAMEQTKTAFQRAGAEQAASSSNGFRPDDLAAAIKLELRGGFKWSPNEIAESLVDGIEVPIRFALQGKPSLAGNPRMNLVEWSDVALELNLGIMFRHAEDLWDDCLWNEYGVRQKGRTMLFYPEDIDSKRGYAMGHMRRLSLSMGYFVMATKVHRELTAAGALPRVLEVRSIEHDGKRQVIRVSKSIEQTRAQEELYVLRGFANDPYYSELLSEPLPSLGGLSLSVVLDAWIVVSRSATLLVEAVSESEALQGNADGPAHTWLPGFAPVLRTDALVHALSAAAGIQPADGRRLVEFFTFRGEPGQEIWAAPLVPVGPSSVAPVFAAVVSPNLRRLVDVWMRQVGIELDRRGPAFEAHLRASAAHSIRSSKVLADHAICLSDDYSFKPSGQRKEQIDLLIAIGSVVLLAEAKCILEPTESKGVAMHRKTVLGAAEQAKRKAQSLTTNRKEFVADLRRFGIALPEDFQVVPVVVLSSSSHVGVPADGVPVVDEYILGKFLEGELEDVAVTGGDYTIQKTVRTAFYANPIEAQERAADFLLNPPQVRHLVEGIRGRFVPLHPIDDQDWEGLAFALECVPPRRGAPDSTSDGEEA